MRSRTLIGTFLHRQSSPIGGGDSNANHKRISFWGLLDQIRALIQSVRGKKIHVPRDHLSEYLISSRSIQPPSLTLATGSKLMISKVPSQRQTDDYSR